MASPGIPGSQGAAAAAQSIQMDFAGDLRQWKQQPFWSSLLASLSSWQQSPKGRGEGDAEGSDAGEGVCLRSTLTAPRCGTYVKQALYNRSSSSSSRAKDSEVKFILHIVCAFVSCLLSLEQVLSCPGKLFAGSQSIWLRAGQAGSRVVGPGQATLSIVTGKLSNFVDSLAFNCDCQFTRQMRR